MRTMHLFPATESAPTPSGESSQDWSSSVESPATESPTSAVRQTPSVGSPPPQGQEGGVASYTGDGRRDDVEMLSGIKAEIIQRETEIEARAATTQPKGV